ncbi:MAG: SCO family protein [Alphaproteobacteria bacterium]|nr:SCO family protein [Alphaproteobacteria bacterium]
MSSTKLISALVALIIILIGAGIYVYNDKSAATYDQVSTSALIGGDFALTDHNGQAVTQADYAGTKKLVFFGFTNCPAVCPTELYNISATLDELGAEDAKKLQVLFISIDPETDTPELMKEYVEAFHDDFIGLTGTVAQVAKAAKAYRVYYAKIPEEDSEMGYTMDHSAYSYLMDEDNKYLTHLPPNSQIEDMVAKIKEFL